ncbi:uncharacterized protein LOC123533811 [Mercenaria mercenaria]|uniref:uncharacterized protein LOC123533811 n=1 Tax=Mercenaria mercenaria TaxID=6596 RepID=UPI001E1D3EF0|nr:uncharacterized protein LOC123533811 [Mercenaria mercenaria]XP_045171624.1 uncharacterized protein LOC123533811 [Mercenaria mercenaria]XP_045171626.1 uncharacterized protein LOC123533811 [Mercenaria mercenaria]XP_045171627.1 uncharacterized protein LOC123533811 [Mercenaria mercenaria]XP_053375697.1 uncharacterized protein LOC123533811 [Mercenaria mercenaria]
MDDSLTIVLLGPDFSGKTELCNRFAGNDFKGDTPAPYGPVFHSRLFGHGRKKVFVGLWDTPGHERYFGVNEMFLRRTHVHGIVFVYDITVEKNFVQAKELMEKQKWILAECEVIVVGNKCDLEHRREVSTFKGYELANEYSAKFFEVSAKTNVNVQHALSTLLRSALARKDRKKDIVPEEIGQDPFALLLYEKALQSGKEKDKSIRVNIVGNFRQGKTTLMRRLLGQKIKVIKSTDGIVVEHYKCEKDRNGKLRYTKADDIDKSEYVKRLVFVAVSEKKKNTEMQVQSLTESNVLHDTKPKVLESSVNEDNRDLRRDLNAETKNVSSDGNKTADVLNKISILSQEEKGVFAEALKTNPASPQQERQTVFDIWDFGGQYIFYATHTIFHSKRAIYLLVFDLTLDLNQCISDEKHPTDSEHRNMKYFIQFWMSSIHSFVGSADGSVPKVILVGTHKDKLRGKKDEKERYIKTYFEEIRQIFDGTNLSNHIHSDDFAVDNTDSKDPSLNSLREAIIRTGDKLSETVEIPLKWIQLEKSLLERKHLKLISVKFVMAIDSENEFPLGDMEQIKLFLRYHHAKGTLIYFDEEPISEYVVLDPQYLIDAFKCIITAERFCTNEPEIRPLWKMLLSEGRLEKQLIDRQWGKPDNELDMFMQNKEILLSFLVKHHIISEAKAFDENSKLSSGLGWFVVPSLLSNHSSQTEKTEFLNGKKLTKLHYVLVFNTSPIVPTVYHRLVSAAIGKWPVAKAGKKTLLFKDMCIVRLNVDHAGILEIRHDSIEMTVVSLCHATNVNSEQADSFRRFLESVTVHEFQKLRSTEETSDKPYTIMFRCNHDSHGSSGSENLISLDDMRRGNVVPCPDLMPHDIDMEMAKEEWFQENKKMTVIPDIQLTDKLLSRLSQCIGENWQLLGLELGLTQVQIDHIIEDHPRSAVMRIYAMLQRWCQEDVDKATLSVLVQTLQRYTHVHVDWDKLRNLIDELS